MANVARQQQDEIMTAWHRAGAREAWDVALLWAAGDRDEAGRIVADLDELQHVRDGILSYGGLSVDEVLASRVTSEQIEALRSEAGSAGDLAQVVICDRALDGDFGARAECARVIAAANGGAS